YQSQNSHDSCSRQSHHDPNDSEKSLSLNNDPEKDLEDFKRCVRSMRTIHDKLGGRVAVKDQWCGRVRVVAVDVVVFVDLVDGRRTVLPTNELGGGEKARPGGINVAAKRRGGGISGGRVAVKDQWCGRVRVVAVDVVVFVDLVDGRRTVLPVSPGCDH
nr:hypothetical protein [Tanacetum cinerariifolium]